MKIILLLYGVGVVLTFIIGLVLLWCSAYEGTNSYDYRIAKALIRYALIFPYGIIKIIDLLEQERKEHDS